MPMAVGVGGLGAGVGGVEQPHTAVHGACGHQYMFTCTTQATVHMSAVNANVSVSKPLSFIMFVGT